MRFYLALLTLLGMSIQTWASDAPGGPMLVEREVSGGHVSDEYRGYASKISVRADGSVYHIYHRNEREAWKVEKVLTLAPEILTALAGEAAKITPGALKYPDSPACADAPNTAYRAAKGNTATMFAQNQNCRMGLASEEGSVYHLIAILDGLEAISALRDS